MANKKISEDSPITTVDNNNDLIPIVDVSDTTQAPTGTNKTINITKIKSSLELTKSDVGLGNVDNTSDVNKPVSTAQAAALALKEDAANKGIAGGYAPLDGSVKIPSAYLPSYVDDVLEYADFASLPVTGETGKIYITLDTNFEYRWSGSAYIQIVASPGTTDALVEGVTNLYFTAARVLATVLSGFSAAAGVVSSSDTILSAINKIVGNIALKADLASPNFTGTPTTPTASTGTSNTQIASTAFVQQEITANSDFATAISCLTQLNS